MGDGLRFLMAAVVRALLVPVLLALAWMIWGAASAGAASGDSITAGPVGAGSLNAGPLNTAPVAGIARSAVSAPLASAASQVTPATKLLPVVPTLPAAPSVPAAVTKPVTTVVGTVAHTAGTVIDEASTAVGTVTPATEPVLDTADSLVPAAEDVVSAVPQLPTVPPVPAIPSLPVPSLAVPSLHAVPVPALTPPTPIPDSGGNPQDPPVPPQAASPSPVRPGANTPKTADEERSATPTKTMAPAISTTGAGLPLAGSGRSLAELQMTTPGQRELAGASPATHNIHIGDRPGDVHFHSLAVNERTSGNASSGSVGSGAQAAEVAGDWNRTPLNAGARAFDAAQDLPASPAFDPGCSPD